jgi:hypothetical protein
MANLRRARSNAGKLGERRGQEAGIREWVRRPNLDGLLAGQALSSV